MKIKKEITETIEAEIDLSKPLFFGTAGGQLYRKFVVIDNEIISTWVSTTTGLDIRVSKAFGSDFKVLTGGDKDFLPIPAATYYKALNEAINKHLPLIAEELQLTPEETELDKFTSNIEGETEVERDNRLTNTMIGGGGKI